MKKLYLLIAITSAAYAEDFIPFDTYVQNTNSGVISAGGTKTYVESVVLSKSYASRFLTDGTYNVNTAVFVNNINSNNDVNAFAYGTNIFAQSGNINGFSLGGNLVVANPFFANKINNNSKSVSQFLPTNQVVFPSQLYLEYRDPTAFNINIGWLMLNTPWMSSINPNALVTPTYEGISTNMQITKELSLNILYVDRWMPISANGFTQDSLYNYKYENGTATGNIGNATSPGSLASGLVYNDVPNALHGQLWLYNFQNYADLIYADSGYTYKFNKDFSINGGLQTGIENPDGSNIMKENGYNSPNSSMVGAQIGFNYSITGIMFGYNDVFANGSNTFSGGGLVSPYTYQYANDPLYTTSVMAGLIEKSGGQAYKVTPTINLVNNTVTLLASYAKYVTNAVPDSEEYDGIITYKPVSVPGLTTSFTASYLVQPQDAGGNIQSLLLGMSYLY